MNRALILFALAITNVTSAHAASARYKPPTIDKKAFTQNTPFNIQNFDQIHDGLSYEEVKRLLGRDGIKGVDEVYLGAHGEVYVWFRDRDFVEVGFSDGKVVTYSAYVNRAFVKVK